MSDRENIITSYAAWHEFIDPFGVYSEAAWEALSFDDRRRLAASILQIRATWEAERAEERAAKAKPAPEPEPPTMAAAVDYIDPGLKLALSELLAAHLRLTYSYQDFKTLRLALWFDGREVASENIPLPIFKKEQ